MASEASQDRLARLIRTAREGSEAALSELLEHYRPYLDMHVQRTLGRRIRTRTDSEDVVQSAYARAVSGFDQFRGTTEPEFSSWITQIVRSTALDVLRANSADKRDLSLEKTVMAHQSEPAMLSWIQPVADAPTPSVIAMRGEAALQLARALQRLSEDHRTAITMRFLEDRKLAEIAEEMDRSPDAVIGLIRRGLKQLRKELKMSEFSSTTRDA